MPRSTGAGFDGGTNPVYGHGMTELQHDGMSHATI